MQRQACPAMGGSRLLTRSNRRRRSVPSSTMVQSMALLLMPLLMSVVCMAEAITETPRMRAFVGSRPNLDCVGVPSDTRGGSIMREITPSMQVVPRGGAKVVNNDDKVSSDSDDDGNKVGNKAGNKEAESSSHDMIAIDDGDDGLRDADDQSTAAEDQMEEDADDEYTSESKSRKDPNRKSKSFFRWIFGSSSSSSDQKQQHEQVLEVMSEDEDEVLVSVATDSETASPSTTMSVSEDSMDGESQAEPRTGDDDATIYDEESSDEEALGIDAANSKPALVGGATSVESKRGKKKSRRKNRPTTITNGNSNMTNIDAQQSKSQSSRQNNTGGKHKNKNKITDSNNSNNSNKEPKSSVANVKEDVDVDAHADADESEDETDVGRSSGPNDAPSQDVEAEDETASGESAESANAAVDPTHNSALMKQKEEENGSTKDEDSLVDEKDDVQPSEDSEVVDGADIINTNEFAGNTTLTSPYAKSEAEADTDARTVTTTGQQAVTATQGNVTDDSDALATTAAAKTTTAATPGKDVSSQSLSAISSYPQSPPKSESPWTSSGAWQTVDAVLSLGLSKRVPLLRLSRNIRPIRKFSAKLTGLHGVMSGKPHESAASIGTNIPTTLETSLPTNATIESIRNRIAAIDRARAGVERAIQAENQRRKKARRGLFRRRGATRDVASLDDASPAVDEASRGNGNNADAITSASASDLSSKEEEIDQDQLDVNVAEDLRLQQQRLLEMKVRWEEERRRREEMAKEERERMERVREIDRLITAGQEDLQKLVCEKDVLQRRPNPLWNYETTTTKEEKGKQEADEKDSESSMQASRDFNFPADDLVEEYLDMVFSSRKLIRMNHTHLWKNTDEAEEEEETIGDDLLTPSADAHRLYASATSGAGGSWNDGDSVPYKNSNSGGSWLLRQSLIGGPSLGEKIGETVETAAYKAVCKATMSFLARILSSLHGVNVMQHSDIRLYLEQAPDLPPIGHDAIPDAKNYAEEAIKTVMKRKSKKHRRRSKGRHHRDETFVQHDAVTEMLLSHCQISAPLLTLFPLAWQRALLGNIITLATNVMSDFFDGLQFQILGHTLSFAFKPITAADMMNHVGFAGRGFNNRRAKPEEFEIAVKATAEDVSEGLKILDQWHHKILGGGVVRTQIANLIARIVLTLTDEILSGAKMDLWSTQAGGPRMMVGLEYRIKQDSGELLDDDDDDDSSPDEVGRQERSGDQAMSGNIGSAMTETNRKVVSTAKTTTVAPNKNGNGKRRGGDNRKK